MRSPRRYFGSPFSSGRHTFAANPAPDRHDPVGGDNNVSRRLSRCSSSFTTDSTHSSKNLNGLAGRNSPPIPQLPIAGHAPPVSSPLERPVRPTQPLTRSAGSANLGRSSRLSNLLGSVPAASSQAVAKMSSSLKVRFSSIFDRDSSMRALTLQHSMLADRGYFVQYELGSGGQGIVVRAYCNAGTATNDIPLSSDSEMQEEVAIKIIPIAKSSTKQMQELRAEIDILSSLPPHPNIVRFIESFENEKYCYIVTELLTGGDLLEHVLRTGKPVPEPQAIDIALQITNALVYLHAQGISHRDLKLENFVWSHHPVSPNAVLKLIDFGLAFKRQPHGPLLVQDFPGTSNYESPELILKRPHVPEQSDMWCFGVCLWCILTSHFPFFARDRRALRGAIVQSDPVYVGMTWKPISAKTRSLLANLLSKEAELRPTASETRRHLTEISQAVSRIPQTSSLDRASGGRVAVKIRAMMTSLRLPERKQRRK